MRMTTSSRHLTHYDCALVAVDILNQTAVLDNEINSPVDEQGGDGFYSWSFPPRAAVQPLRFIALNGDYTAKDVAWKDLDAPFPGETWDKPNLPTQQRAWLAAQLDAAHARTQRVILFVHYRLDGGPGGPVGTGLGPAIPKSRRGWVNSCSLQNSDAVRAILEKYPGQVLATFSGHDHAPVPPYTREAASKPLYFTHAGMIEGQYPGSNAYSIVRVMEDCGIQVEGFKNASSLTIPGPPGCRMV